MKASNSQTLEYLILGISKENKDDLMALYDALHVEVFSAVLCIVKDKRLARDISVETFRRVRDFAYRFDTELNAREWVLHIATTLAYNAHNSKELCVEKPEIDNASDLAITFISGLKNDRALMMSLSILSGLKIRTIAGLANYYVTSTKNELRRGIHELNILQAGHDNHGHVIKENLYSKKELIANLLSGLKEIVPDYKNLILQDEPTCVSALSHEEFIIPDPEPLTAEQKAKRVRRNIVIISIISVLVIALGITAWIIIKKINDEQTNPLFKEEEIVTTTGNHAYFSEVGGVIYYIGSDGYIYAAYDDAPMLVLETKVHELCAVGTHLVYREEATGKIFSFIPGANALPISVTNVSGSALTGLVSGDIEYVYFSVKGGIARADVSKTTPGEDLEYVYIDETDETPIRYDMHVLGDGTIIFSSGAECGIYKVYMLGDTPSLAVLSQSEVYFFDTVEGVILYDEIVSIDSKSHDKIICAIDKDKLFFAGEETNFFQNFDKELLTYTSAFTAYKSEGSIVIYYEGYEIDGDGYTSNIGLYKATISNDGTVSKELIHAMDNGDMHISDMYISKDNDTLYCFFSDGKSGGVREVRPVALPITNGN